MKDDENEYQSIIQMKCPYCFRKDACICLPSQRATLCLGPFKDKKDWCDKINAEIEKEKEKPDFRRYEGKRRIEEYLLKKVWLYYKQSDSDDNKS